MVASHWLRQSTPCPTDGTPDGIPGAGIRGGRGRAGFIYRTSPWQLRPPWRRARPFSHARASLGFRANLLLSLCLRTAGKFLATSPSPPVDVHLYRCRACQVWQPVNQRLGSGLPGARVGPSLSPLDPCPRCLS